MYVYELGVLADQNKNCIYNNWVFITIMQFHYLFLNFYYFQNSIFLVFRIYGIFRICNNVFLEFSTMSYK